MWQAIIDALPRVAARFTSLHHFALHQHLTLLSNALCVTDLLTDQIRSKRPVTQVRSIVDAFRSSQLKMGTVAGWAKIENEMMEAKCMAQLMCCNDRHAMTTTHRKDC